jgi:hypothetical protein
MRLLLKPWFAVVVTLIVLLVWAVTVGPWGPSHDHSRTALAWHVAVSTHPAARHAALSPAFLLTGDPAQLRFFASPPSAGRGFPVADVQWSIVGAETRGTGLSGDAGLMPTEPDSGAIRLGSENGSGLHGTYRLRISTRLTSSGVISATIAERRDRQTSVGGVPAFWLIVLVGTAYVSLTVIVLRRKYPPNPVMTPPQRERY